MDKYRITVLKGHVFIIIVRTYPLPAVNKWIGRVKREEEQRKFGELKETSSPRGRQCCFTSSWKLYRLVLGEVRFVSSSVCLAVCLSVFVEPPSHIQGHSHFHTTSHKNRRKFWGEYEIHPTSEIKILAFLNSPACDSELKTIIRSLCYIYSVTG